MKNDAELSRQRGRLLVNLERLLEGPMVTLGFIWLLLLILDLTGKSNKSIEQIGTIIWALFIVDFVLKFALAPQKAAFLKKNWLTAISLLIPALRFLRAFRIVRLARVFRSTRLIRVISSVNRGMRSLNATMSRRGFPYVIILTIAIVFAGSAGMLGFEKGTDKLETFGEALWWTIMVVMTVGTDYWPQTLEGRILCILLAIYGFAVFGYITATLASFFIDRDAEDKRTPLAGSADIKALQNEIRELKKLISDKIGAKTK